MNLAAFWIPNAAGFVRFAFVLSWFVSGFLMPLRYFPDWFVKICAFTPFPYTVNTVVEIYLGIVQGPEVVLALVAQLIWGGGSHPYEPGGAPFWHQKTCDIGSLRGAGQL